MRTNRHEDRWTSPGVTTSWDEVPRERGRLARMHRRRESLSMSTMWQPATLAAGTA